VAQVVPRRVSLRWVPGWRLPLVVGVHEDLDARQSHLGICLVVDRLLEIDPLVELLLLQIRQEPGRCREVVVVEARRQDAVLGIGVVVYRQGDHPQVIGRYLPSGGGAGPGHRRHQQPQQDEQQGQTHERFEQGECWSATVAHHLTSRDSLKNPSSWPPPRSGEGEKDSSNPPQWGGRASPPPVPFCSPSPLRGGGWGEGSTPSRLPVVAEDIVAGGRDGRLPRLVGDLFRVDGPDAAVTPAHENRVSKIARPSPPPPP